MSESELKPCPFCGSEHILLSPPCNDAPDEDLFLNSYQVVCQNCYCVGQSKETEDEVIAAWNTRAERTNSALLLELHTAYDTIEVLRGQIEGLQDQLADLEG